MKSENIFDGIPDELPEELFRELLGSEPLGSEPLGNEPLGNEPLGNEDTGGTRVERIVSRGQSSPQGFWYDGQTAEWVIVLRGSAGILFEGDAEPVELGPGSYLNIPAHRKHRVAWTDPHEVTVWLAIHYGG